jgi:hypothetical protein
MNVIQRMQSPTPSFFKKVRKIALILAAVSGAILAAPATLPATLVTVASYMGIAASVATAISQTATEDDLQKK